MSKKTKRHTRRHTRRHRKHTRRHRKHTRRYNRRQIMTLPGSQGVPLFSVPEKKHTQKILVNSDKQSGNMIPGLRTKM